MLREYVVAIDTVNHEPTILSLYAQDRDDAIAFVRHVYRHTFAAKKFKKIISARLRGEPVTSEVTSGHGQDPAGAGQDARGLFGARSNDAVAQAGDGSRA